MLNISSLRAKLLAASLVAPLALAAGVATAGSSIWEIGPIVKGRSLSPGMPAAMDETRAGPVFDFSTSPRAHVHYVTRPTSSLEGARSITLKYRIDARPGTRFIAQQHPEKTPGITLYFQRRGDNWTAKRQYETYRWYADISTMAPVTPGTHKVTVRLDDKWKAVGRTTNDGNPRAFEDALRNAGRVGFVFGSAGGRGHGVYATAPARFTLLDFRVN